VRHTVERTPALADGSENLMLVPTLKHWIAGVLAE